MSIYYLYVKTHLVTGLKYLGQTRSKDPHKYPGSGTYWKSHLKLHGKHYDTTILKECLSHDELVHWGTHYSQLWNVVDSDEWANLMNETGDGSSAGIKRSAEFCANQSKRLKGSGNPMYGQESPFKGKKHKEESLSVMRAKRKGRAPHNKGKKMSAEFCQTISKNHHDVKGENNPMYGKTHSEHTKMLISQKRTGQKASLESRANQSAARKGKPWSEARRAAYDAKKQHKLAHELVHVAQHQIMPLAANDGATGSDIENEANALAGILMRLWGQRHSN